MWKLLRKCQPFGFFLTPLMLKFLQQPMSNCQDGHVVNYNKNNAKVSVNQDGEKPPVTPVKMSPVTLPTSTNQQEPILTSNDNSS